MYFLIFIIHKLNSNFNFIKAYIIKEIYLNYKLYLNLYNKLIYLCFQTFIFP